MIPSWDVICQECGNDLATVVLSSGMMTCTDCAEKLEP